MRFLALPALLALLGTLAPVTVKVCPEAATSSCGCGCCGDEAPAPCDCQVERSLPDADGTISVPVLPGLAAFVLPAAAERLACHAPSRTLSLRLEPRWDPGNAGFLPPLRL